MRLDERVAGRESQGCKRNSSLNDPEAKTLLYSLENDNLVHRTALAVDLLNETGIERFDQGKCMKKKDQEGRVEKQIEPKVTHLSTDRSKSEARQEEEFVLKDDLFCLATRLYIFAK